MNHEEFLEELRQDPEYVQAERDLRFHTKLADAILFARMAKGWSQTDLARRVQTRQANISRIEAYLANPTLDLIRRLCDVLEIEITFDGPSILDEHKVSTIVATPTTTYSYDDYIRVDNDDRNVFCPNYETGSHKSNYPKAQVLS